MPLGLFRSQQNSAVTRLWRSCGVQASHKERAIGAVRCKKEGMLLQPLRWRCVECVIHHERDVREEQQYIYVARTSNNRVTLSGDFYCCLLPQCEALHTCRSGFSDHNTRKPITGSKDLDCSIISNKNFSQKIPSSSWSPGTGNLGQNCQKPIPRSMSPMKNLKSQTFQFFKMQTRGLAASLRV